MALTRIKKEEKVSLLTKELAGSTSAIVGTFAKLTVSQDFELRSVVRTAGGRYRVLKNKLAARASKGSKIEEALQGLKGVSSVAYTSGDPVALAKALSTWVKDNAQFTFKLGIIDGRVITVEEVQQLATMPGKEELYAKLLFLIQSPAQQLATVINAAGRDLAVVINQAVEQNKFAAGVDTTPPEAVPATETISEATPTPGASAATETAPVETDSKPDAAEANPEPAVATPVADEGAAEPAEEVTADSAQTEAAGSEAPAEGATTERGAE